MKFKLITTLKKALQVLPTRLPITTDEMNKLISDVITINGFPDDPSYHHAMASSIMHLGPLCSHASKRYFAKSIRKAIANQVAYNKIKSLKDEEKKAAEKELLNQEVTPLTVNTNDGPSLQNT